MNKTEYTLGFLFNKGLTQVALIHKKRPTWQYGRFNGIGGHIEDEGALDCMRREFSEEAFYPSDMPDWKQYAILDGPEFLVFCFAAIGDTSIIKSKTSEEVVVIPVNSINPTRTTDFVENVPWLVSLAIDHLKDGRPSLVTAQYV